MSESYPSLKTNAGFSELRTTLEGCENRISTERMRYNEMVRNYNRGFTTLSGNMLAGGFAPMPYFEAEAGTEKAPKVDFN